jgi:hypothetical protein
MTSRQASSTPPRGILPAAATGPGAVRVRDCPLPAGATQPQPLLWHDAVPSSSWLISTCPSPPTYRRMASRCSWLMRIHSPAVARANCTNCARSRYALDCLDRSMSGSSTAFEDRAFAFGDRAFGCRAFGDRAIGARLLANCLGYNWVGQLDGLRRPGLQPPRPPPHRRHRPRRHQRPPQRPTQRPPQRPTQRPCRPSAGPGPSVCRPGGASSAGSSEDSSPSAESTASLADGSMFNTPASMVVGSAVRQFGKG